MPDNHFEELKEWSARKHRLLISYLEGFVKILGSRARFVYYVDGFSGPGLYRDGEEGSPLLAAEYAESISGKSYNLQCINVELDSCHFSNLQENTRPFAAVTTNHEGKFGDYVDTILGTIGRHPAIFFLDPFGLKGIEWEHISKVLSRRPVTELLIRIDPKDMNRLAGFWNSQKIGAAAKRNLLTEVFGFPESNSWISAWEADGTEGLLGMYLSRLHEEMNEARGDAYVQYYPIRTLDGILKYYLVYTTGHPKGAVLMNDVIYNVEEQYQHDVEEYKRSKVHQLGLFAETEPTEDEVFQNVVNRLIPDIARQFSGKRASRLDIRVGMQYKWFGQCKGSHFTHAFREMEEKGTIISKSDILSSDDTLFQFK